MNPTLGLDPALILTLRHMYNDLSSVRPNKLRVMASHGSSNAAGEEIHRNEKANTFYGGYWNLVHFIILCIFLAMLVALVSNSVSD